MRLRSQLTLFVATTLSSAAYMQAGPVAMAACTGVECNIPLKKGTPTSKARTGLPPPISIPQPPPPISPAPGDPDSSGVSPPPLAEQFYLQNFGDQRIAAILLTSERKACGEVQVAAGGSETVAACGKYLIWNDGTKTREIEFHLGRAYKIHWDGVGWAIDDVTGDIQ